MKPLLIHQGSETRQGLPRAWFGAVAGLTAAVSAECTRRRLGGSRPLCLSVACASSDTLEKPETHRRRTYQHFRLDNGLQVVIASDPTCDKAAAAMSVGVGRLHEPKDMPGLAHFCEHMLFLGTEAFPDEAEYKRFLKGHGGKCNAATGDNRTTYMFDISPDYLAGALDRFSHFFRTPLLSPSATEREINAVDSEHSMRLTDDGRRSYASLLMDANPAHPLHWGSGNANSLRDVPRAQGKDPHQEVVNFYKKNYTSEDMALVILGRESLDELRKMVEERFADVPKTGQRSLRGDEHGGPEPPILPKDFKGLVTRVPTKDTRSVSFSWQMDKWQVPYWASKPAAYAEHFLGHEGEGSLLSALKRAGLATSLSAGLDEFGCFSHFEVHVNLSEEGFNKIKEVGEYVFTYVSLLRESEFQSWAVQEIQGIRQLKFRFADDRQPYDLVTGIANNLQLYPPEKVLSAGILLPSPDPNASKEVLHRLTPDKLRVEWVGKALADRCQDTDPWYHGKYSKNALDPEWTEAWTKAASAASKKAAQEAASAKGMHLNTPNPFIPERLDLLPETEKKTPGPATLECSEIKGLGKVFHHKDHRFLQPKALATFRIHSPYAAEDPGNYLRTQIWCSSVMEELNEHSYDAKIAGLFYDLSPVPGGIEIEVGGFNDKLPVLLDIVTKKLREASTIAPETFRIVQDRFKRGLRNAAEKQRPCDYAGRKNRELLYNLAFPPEERLELLEKLSLDDMNNENARILDSCQIDTLVAGNVQNTHSKEWASNLAKGISPLDTPKKLATKAEAALPPGSTLWRVPGTNKEEKNNCVRLTLQLPATMDSYVFISLFVRILNPKFFESLRTKQQLGYIVQMAPSETENFMTVIAYVQTEYSPDYVRSRIDEFFKTHLEWIDKELEEPEFARQRSGLVSNLAEAPKTLSGEFDRYWHEIILQRYDWSRREKKKAAMEAATLSDFRKFVKDHVANASKLYIEVHNISGSTPKQPKEVDADSIPAPVDRTWDGPDAAHTFRNSASWYSKGSPVRNPYQRTQSSTPPASKL